MARLPQSKLRLGRVADLLGLTENNWSRVELCKPVPKRVYLLHLTLASHGCLCVQNTEFTSGVVEQTLEKDVPLSERENFLRFHILCMDRNRYKIGEPPATQDGSAGGSTEETDAAAAAAADADAEARASLTVRLHQLALFLSVQQTSILKKQVRTLEEHLHVLIAFQY